jgi:hypothetical protein
MTRSKGPEKVGGPGLAYEQTRLPVASEVWKERAFLIYPPRSPGAPHLARFSRDVGFRRSRPAPPTTKRMFLRRPGFLLTNGHGRNTQVSKARPGPPTHYSSAPFSSRQKNDAGRTTHRRVLPRERQLPCLAVHSKRRDDVTALIARIQECSGRIELYVPWVISPG